MSTLAPAKVLRHGVLGVLSSLRERRLRMPSLRFLLSPGAQRARTPLQRKAVDELRENGITRIEGFIDPETVQILRSGVEEMAQACDARAARDDANAGPATAEELDTFVPPEHQYDVEDLPAAWSSEIQVYSANDPFFFRQQLYDIALREDLQAIVNSYFRREVNLGRGLSVRHMPIEKRDRFQWAWHHDGWGRKLNVQIVLSDLVEGGNHLIYKAGSHRTYHGYRRFMSLSIDEDEVERRCGHMPTISTVGAKAGDIFILDGNGIHCAMSGNDVRDANLLMFYPDATFSFGHKITDETLGKYPEGRRRPLAQLLRTNRINAASQRHDVRPLYGVNWIESLPHVLRWLV